MTEPFRMFDVRVDRLQRLSPSFLRVTFTGDDLHLFADNGFDQRIKLFLPVPQHGLRHLPTGAGWFHEWRALDDGRRNPMRTYTARLVRPEAREVDVDIVLHPDGGPAARWAESVRPGDAAALLGPDAGFEGTHGGVEFHPPEGTGCVLIAGDETAVPAICAILERLPSWLAGEVVMEVPCDDDQWPVLTDAPVKVTWLARNGAPRGEALIPAVRAAAGRLLPSQPAPADDTFEDLDVDAVELWEVPQEDASPHGPLYAWLAGEAGVIKLLRRHLVAERGVDRRSVAFMGYWREGRAEQYE
ncbi:NADPH-dependent ferric siderophore reductase, contains FAD-binding and SIP domains [Nonomuraea maritima]|uniref:NADPH-dependent ferric siderophore reductase, contains FAD-binding and SIP domains n=1 Tax=Nonomuraea maritima TaxID=683260 RepID=A0A1G9CSE8_9ACTN|nr:siderophore-interacting protein [Nonomuraea maritima]SDK54641.1 NADPH-dependent ferric siderophore reductase, contains FAD-binding and SIP domains [Nonomuraea maritima]